MGGAQSDPFRGQRRSLPGAGLRTKQATCKRRGGESRRCSGSGLLAGGAAVESTAVSCGAFSTAVGDGGAGDVSQVSQVVSVSTSVPFTAMLTTLPPTRPKLSPDMRTYLEHTG
eukprot:1196266-Prorocentrum_minimum.AAC.1